MSPLLLRTQEYYCPFTSYPMEPLGVNVQANCRSFESETLVGREKGEDCLLAPPCLCDISASPCLSGMGSLFSHHLKRQVLKAALWAREAEGMAPKKSKGKSMVI